MTGDGIVAGQGLQVHGVLQHDVPHLLHVLELGGRESDVLVVVVGEEPELAHVGVQRVNVKSTCKRKRGKEMGKMKESF